MKIKKILSAVMAGVMLAAIPSGCNGSGKKDASNTLTINFGINNVEVFIEGLSKKFPDINFEVEPTYCVNPSSYLRKTLVTGNSSDIFYYTQKPNGEEASKYLLDLSGYDFISSFDRSVINTYIVDGHIYSIPGPMAIRGVAYNKTLFDEHGWKKPESHRELVELCKKIRSETDDITPIAMSMGGLAYPFTLVSTLSQAGFLGTPAGEEWEKRFMAGEASIAEGFGEGLKMTGELIDAGAFNTGDYVGVWDGEACQLEFTKGKAAMFIMWGSQARVIKAIEESTDYEYAFMPFYGMEEGQIMIGANSGYTWGIPKRLGEPGNEKKLKNALRVMEWFATPEAQDLMKSYITDENGNQIPASTEILPLNTAGENKNSSPYLLELWEQADKGNKMHTIYSGYESIIIDGGTIVQDAMISGSSEGMTDKFVSAADEDYKGYLSGGDDLALCEVTADFTEAETAQLLADGLNEGGLGDFVLITHAGRAGVGIDNKVGAGVRYIAGTLTNQDYNVILGSLKSIQTLSLTGKQVRQLLSEGKRVYSTVNESEFADFPYYWAGIDVKLSSDGKAESVKLNGSELEDDTRYKVVFCNGDYTEEVGNAGEAADTEVNMADYWMDYISKHKTLSPPEVLRK